MSVKAGQASLLGGNWTSTLVDGAHLFAVLGFLQQSPVKLPLKCVPWHRSCRSSRKARCSGAHLGRAPARGPGPASFLPLRAACAETRREGRLTWQGGARGRPQSWSGVVHPTLQELRAPTAWTSGRCGHERRRCSDYLPIGASTGRCSRGWRQPAHLQSAERADGSVVRVRRRPCPACLRVHGQYVCPRGHGPERQAWRVYCGI